MLWSWTVKNTLIVIGHTHTHTLTQRTNSPVCRIQILIGKQKIFSNKNSIENSGGAFRDIDKVFRVLLMDFNWECLVNCSCSFSVSNLFENNQGWWAKRTNEPAIVCIHHRNGVFEYIYLFFYSQVKQIPFMFGKDQVECKIFSWA